jgi:hypothetical protein
VQSFWRPDISALYQTYPASKPDISDLARTYPALLF